MNWYKNIIIFSSHNIKFPENLDDDINKIVEEAVNYYYSNEEKPKITDNIDIIDPYTKEEDKIIFIIQPFTIDFINTIATFNPQNRVVSIFPYHHNLENFNEQILFQHYKEKIYHEIAHFTDPKFKIKDFWKNRNKINYLLREEEFDAYSKEMEIVVKSNLNNNNIEEFKQWLRDGGINFLPVYLNFYREMILYWYENKPEYIKMLKQRLYNVMKGYKNAET